MMCHWRQLCTEDKLAGTAVVTVWDGSNLSRLTGRLLAGNSYNGHSKPCGEVFCGLYNPATAGCSFFAKNQRQLISQDIERLPKSFSLIETKISWVSCQPCWNMFLIGNKQLEPVLMQCCINRSQFLLRESNTSQTSQIHQDHHLLVVVVARIPFGWDWPQDQREGKRYF